MEKSMSEPSPRAPEAVDISIWEHARREKNPAHAEQRRQLAEHFEAMHDLLERMGHRPFGRLELHLPGYAFDSAIIFRWERPR